MKINICLTKFLIVVPILFSPCVTNSTYVFAAPAKGSKAKPQQKPKGQMFKPLKAVILKAYNNPNTKYGIISVNLEWTENKEENFSFYEIHRSTTPNFTPNEETKHEQQENNYSDTNFEDSQIEPSTTYYYKVLVHPVEGKPTASNEVKIITSPAPKPEVTNLRFRDESYAYSAPRSHKEVYLEWDISSGEDFHQYEIYRAQTPNFQISQQNLIDTSQQISEPEFCDKNLKPNTTYYYKIGLRLHPDRLLLSNELQYTTKKQPPPTKVPTPILKLSKPATFSVVELEWDADTARDFERYELHRSTNFNFVPGTKSLIHKLQYFERIDYTEYTDEQLKPGTTYFYRLKTFHENGTFATSKVLTVRTLSQKPAPFILSLASKPTRNRVSLTWTKQPAIDFRRYDIFSDEQKKWLASDAPLDQIFDASTNTVNDDLVEPNKKYYYVVYFYGPDEQPVKSNILLVRTPK